MKKSHFLSAPEMEQIVSIFWVCIDPENSAFGGQRPVPHHIKGEEEDVDNFVSFKLRSIDGYLYLSCYEVWEKGDNPLQAYASSEDKPTLYEYQGKDYYVQACDIPLHEWTCDSLESMLRLMLDHVWEKNAFLRILLDLDMDSLRQECSEKPGHLKEVYEDAKVKHHASRRFFSSKEI